MEAVESMKSMIPNEVAVVEAVEATKAIISIEVSVAKASQAPMVNSSWERGALASVPSNLAWERGALASVPSNYRDALSSAPSQSMLRKRILPRNQGEVEGQTF
jgi:hypothetical protein